MRTNIRKWGSSAGTVIPEKALVKAGFSLGDTVEIIAMDGQIVIKQVTPKYNLDDLLASSPNKALELDDEDRAWLYWSKFW